MKTLIFILLLAAALLKSMLMIPQEKLEVYAAGFEFKEGIYFTYQEFKTNSPSITQFRIVAAEKFIWQDIQKGAAIKWVEYRDSIGYQRILKQNDIWGLCFRNEIYIYKADALQRIKVIGALMLVDEVRHAKNVNASFGSTGSYVSGGGDTYMTKTKIVDFVTGISSTFNLKNFESLLIKDKALYEEFNKLEGNKMKKQKMSDYLIIFNNRNPIYFKVKGTDHAFEP